MPGGIIAYSGRSGKSWAVIEPRTGKAIGKGGLAPCAANGANEEAVRLFLEGRIPFLKIGELVEGVVDSEAFGGPYTLDDVYACDAAARAYVLAHVS